MPCDELAHALGAMFPPEARMPVKDALEMSEGMFPAGHEANQEMLVHRLCTMLSKPLLSMTERRTHAYQAGVSRKSHTLVLDVCHIAYHEGDDIDWRTQHTMRYVVGRDGDDIVLRPLRRDEAHEMGAVGWCGTNHGDRAIGAWRNLLSEGDEEQSHGKGQWQAS